MMCWTGVAFKGLIDVAELLVSAGARVDTPAEVTPGVTARSFDQATGGQVYMLRGSEIENHVVQIDGADVGDGFNVFDGYSFQGAQQQVYNAAVSSAGTLVGSSLLATLTNTLSKTAAPTSKTAPTSSSQTSVYPASHSTYSTAHGR